MKKVFLLSFFCLQLFAASWIYSKSSASFIPTDDPETQLWFDMADAAHRTAPAGVYASIDDKSTHAHNGTFVYGNAPTVLAADKNGNDVMHVDGGTIGFNTGDGQILDQTKPYAIYIVHKFTAYTDYNILVTLKGNVGTQAPFFALTGGYGMWATASQWAPTNTPSISRDSNYHLIAFLYNGSGSTTLSNFSTYYDGVLQSMVAGSQDNGADNTLASYTQDFSNSGYRFTGNYGEVIVSQSVSTYVKMNSYLQTKWF